MRFYVVTSDRGGTIGCETTLAAAHVIGNYESEGYSITKVDCLVNVETVRRLLGQLGGYAIKSTTRDYNSKVTP